MIRVVGDTNVYVSALMFGGVPRTFLELPLVRSFALVASAPLLDELDDKLRVKFGVPPKDAAAIRARLESVAHMVEPDVILKVIEDDPDDNRVLECAVKGRADYIVSGDRHLLKLGSYEAIPIVTVRQFLDAVATESSALSSSRRTWAGAAIARSGRRLGWGNTREEKP